ncbi:S9 family peptidase [Bacillus luteolus]|uniref:S9 family peptidase n=1 Tax=Litchfieldia luteola TaxID=682179 RepID=A0ABR9QDE3_9BACI|nr:S9 family peptidase [Cytobacillus luteolus]MBE4906520.1 S9 family peptidase [Cytobacillus luteolus]MBP1941203.1 dipeptidyl aminopeptidase/acylaminoacyl peptidase [Cytobacillus luteolus]
MRTTNQIEVEPFLKTLSISAFTINNTETELYLSMNKTGTYNLWKMNLSDQNKLSQLTFHNQKTSEIAVVPTKDSNYDTIYFTSDRDGNELSHIYTITTNGEKWKDIRTNQESMYFLTKISEDGKRLYYSSSKDNPLYLSIFSYDLISNEEVVLHKGSEAETRLLDVSPNEKMIAYFVRKNHSNMKLYIRNEESEIEVISNPVEPYRISNLIFISNEIAYFTTNYMEEYTYLAKFDLSSGQFEKVIEIDKEDIEYLHFNPSTHSVYFQTKSGPVDKLYTYHLENKIVKNINLPTDTIQQFFITENGNIYICGSSPTIPSSIYKKTPLNDWECILENSVPNIPTKTLVNPERMTYKSFDGVEIEAMYYKADESISNNHTIIYTHGGPQYNEQNSYFGLFQYLLQQGFSIFAPNFRGTPNYGTSFLKMIERDWGGGPRLDILSGIDQLIEDGKATEEKIITLGFSYGGYMSLLLFGRHQDRFKACVDGFGPSSLFTLIQTCPPHWAERMDTWIGNPTRDNEKLIEHSPISYVDNIRKPLLILQGANDPRVKQSESDQMVLALQNKGIDVEYEVFYDEGHGFSKLENEIYAYKRISEFLMRITEE